LKTPRLHVKIAEMEGGFKMFCKQGKWIFTDQEEQEEDTDRTEILRQKIQELKEIEEQNNFRGCRIKLHV
jgi:hypothetical protein